MCDEDVVDIQYFLRVVHVQYDDWMMNIKNASTPQDDCTIFFRVFRVELTDFYF